jgi:hypothetical protein
LLSKLMGTSVDMIEEHYGHLFAPARRTKPRHPGRDVERIWTQIGRKHDRRGPVPAADSA